MAQTASLTRSSAAWPGRMIRTFGFIDPPERGGGCHLHTAARRKQVICSAAGGTIPAHQPWRGAMHHPGVFDGVFIAMFVLCFIIRAPWEVRIRKIGTVES